MSKPVTAKLICEQGVLYVHLCICYSKDSYAIQLMKEPCTSISQNFTWSVQESHFIWHLSKIPSWSNSQIQTLCNEIKWSSSNLIDFFYLSRCIAFMHSDILWNGTLVVGTDNTNGLCYPHQWSHLNSFYSNTPKSICGFVISHQLHLPRILKRCNEFVELS